MAKQSRFSVLVNAHVQGFWAGVKTFLAQPNVQGGMLVGCGALGLTAIAYPPVMLAHAAPLSPVLIAKTALLIANTVLGFGILGGILSTVWNALSNWLYRPEPKPMPTPSLCNFTNSIVKDFQLTGERLANLTRGASAVVFPVTPFAKAIKAGVVKADVVCIKNRQTPIYMRTQAGKVAAKTIIALERPF